MFKAGDLVKLKEKALKEERRNYLRGEGVKRVWKYLEGPLRIEDIDTGWGAGPEAEANFEWPRALWDIVGTYDSDCWYTQVRNLVKVSGKSILLQL